MISPLLTDIAAVFPVTMAQSGWLFTAYSLGFFILIFAGGWLSTHFGRAMVMTLSLAALGVALILFPLSKNFLLSCGIMFLIGGSGGILESIANAYMVEINPEKPAFYINLSQVFFGVGALVGPLAAGYLVAAGVDWRICYYGCGALSLLLALFFVVLKKPAPVKDEPLSLSMLKKTLFNWKMVLICLCMFLYTGSEIAAWGWLATFLKKELAFTPEKAGIAVALFWLAMIVGRVICTTLTLKIKLKTLIIFLALSSAVATLMGGLVSGEAAFWAVIVAMGLLYSGQWPLIAAYGDSLFEKTPAIVFSLLVGSGGLGISVIPFLVGYVGDNVSIKAAIMTPSIFLVMIVFIFISFRKAPVKIKVEVAEESC